MASPALAALAIAVSPRLEFDSDPLHTKNPNTEAMRTLYDLMDNPVTNPYTHQCDRAECRGRRALKAKLVKLPTVSKVIDIESFVPDDQQAKLAIIADANSILALTLHAARRRRRRSRRNRSAWRRRPRWRRSIRRSQSCRRIIPLSRSPPICARC